MEAGFAERRSSRRDICVGVAGLTIQNGPYRGATLVGLIRDISDGGICIMLDGGTFERGTAVQVQTNDGLSFAAWVCHCSPELGASRVGFSFAPIDQCCPNDCFDPPLCATSNGSTST